MILDNQVGVRPIVNQRSIISWAVKFWSKQPRSAYKGNELLETVRVLMLPRRWVIFLTSSMLYFVGYFHRVSITVIAADLMRDFSASATSLGLLSSLYFYPYAAMQIPAGLLTDRIGSRKTLTMFCFMTSVGTLIFAFSPNLSSAMVGRTLVGLGVSVAFLCTAKLIASWFDAKSFASLTGLLVSIGNVGALIGSAPLAFLIASLGWRFSFLIISAASFALMIALWFEIKDAPKDISSHPYYLHSDSERSGGERNRTADGVWISFRNRDFWFAAFPPLFFFGSFVSLQGLWGVPYLMQVYAFSKIDASIIIMMMAIGFSVGATFWGLVSDRLVVSRRRVFLIGLTLYNLTWFLFASVTIGATSWLLSLYFLLLGFFFGVMPISIVIVKELFPRKMMGAATGSANAFPFIGAALYQLLMGYFLDTYGLLNIEEGVRVFSRASYEIGFNFCLVTLIAATAMAFLIREHQGGIEL